MFQCQTGGYRFIPIGRYRIRYCLQAPLLFADINFTSIGRYRIRYCLRIPLFLLADIAFICQIGEYRFLFWIGPAFFVKLAG
jgi:hypothetical protein